LDRHDVLDEKPNEAKFVFAPSDAPFEAPAKEFVSGPLYKGIEEVIPELDEAIDAEDTQSFGKSGLDRRDFLKAFAASAALTACVRRPEEKVVPYVNQPVDHIVGVANYFATTCGECANGCGVLVKTKEGRPVKIEGLDRHPVSDGGSCAMGQASLQGLFHPERKRKPKIRRGNRMDEAQWDEAFEVLGTRLKDAKKIAVLTGGSTGHRREFVLDWLKTIGQSSASLYQFESNPLYAATAAAYKIAFGFDGLYARPELRAARSVCGIGSDFLDIGISPIMNQKGFAAGMGYRNGYLGTFYQFESGFTNTGAKASERYKIAPGEELAVALHLIKTLMDHSASKGSASERAEITRVLNAQASLLSSSPIDQQTMDTVASTLLEQPSIVFCGHTASDANGTLLQLAAIMANTLVGAYGQTLFLNVGALKSPVPAGDMKRFVEEIDSYDALIVVDVDPAFTLPSSTKIKDKLKKLNTLAVISARANSTAKLADFDLPAHSYLESWGDEQPIEGFWSFRQPVVRPISDSRQAEDALLWVAAAMEKPLGYRQYREYLEKKWRVIYQQAGSPVSFDRFWKESLREGFYGVFQKRNVPSMGNVVSSFVPQQINKDAMKLVSMLDIRLHDGRGADKPVLHEVGDAMTTIAWDSWVAMDAMTARDMGFKRNDVLKVETSEGSLEVALFPMPGMHPKSVYIHRGNGLPEGVSKVSDGYGVDPLNLYPAGFDSLSGQAVTASLPVQLSRTGKIYRLAAMQKSNDIANRLDIVKKMDIATARSRVGKTMDVDTVPDLYPVIQDNPDYKWGMSIDVNACTGCSACMVACSVENNIPQVGRKQIIMGREMHWIRLDRYFAGPVDNPEVSFQPVMCQHCNHAPCEAVCPVFATAHDDEGMNAMTYNRCVGTRYCANACPYKVRRFNWYTHKWNIIENDEKNRNVRPFNPDVTVRTRGVMEKCTLCVQRVREAKHHAKNNLPLCEMVRFVLLVSRPVLPTPLFLAI
jgi:Fe-S-cluster-containing dehydrogenase component/anaerobic selenocysteine-containing dehydrogenase